MGTRLGACHDTRRFAPCGLYGAITRRDWQIRPARRPISPERRSTERLYWLATAFARSLCAMVQTHDPHVSVPSQIRARIYMAKSPHPRLKP